MKKNNRTLVWLALVLALVISTYFSPGSGALVFYLLLFGSAMSLALSFVTFVFYGRRIKHEKNDLGNAGNATRSTSHAWPTSIFLLAVVCISCGNWWFAIENEWLNSIVVFALIYSGVKLPQRVATLKRTAPRNARAVTQ